MATITKRKSGWSVQIRRKGYQPEYRTLATKAAAQKWARERETEIDRGDAPVDRKALLSTTLGDLMRRYMTEVTPTKKSADSERLRMTKMLSAPMCEISLLELSSAPIAAYRDHRLQTVKPGTIARELCEPSLLELSSAAPMAPNSASRVKAAELATWPPIAPTGFSARLL